jgi:hypothetical protein
MKTSALNTTIKVEGNLHTTFPPAFMSRGATHHFLSSASLMLDNTGNVDIQVDFLLRIVVSGRELDRYEDSISVPARKSKLHHSIIHDYLYTAQVGDKLATVWAHAFQHGIPEDILGQWKFCEFSVQ